ncbi:type VI secretion system membrane subunit TssM [Collimonas humicola]|uniref:type VI secretion system membrane subunit TssM n=1 Tax=Collimonas humicola TaxID=2825886 RepID=UPI001B8BA93D|nr:type VI secretion system membrane subunit TssM [Collimonas humicola]
MMRILFRLTIAMLVAAAIWWLAPLISIGVYRPFGWLWIRRMLVALVLVWGIWPLIARLWMSLALGMRQIKPAPKVQTFSSVVSRLNDMDQQLRAQWLERPRAVIARWKGLLGKEYRRALPWFMVLGASNSGKTSLVAEIAQWSHASSRKYPQIRVADAGKLADFDYWITQDAVWLDTSGEWTTRDNINNDSFSAWRQLLQGLRRRRSMPVLNGVVLCVDCLELKNSALEQRKRLADALRSRLAEMHVAHGRQSPVYIAFTGVDKLDGAVPFLGLMSSAQWSKGIGFSLPFTAQDKESDIESGWEQALSDLEHRIQQQVMFSAPAADGAEVNQLQLKFVESVAQLRTPILHFLSLLMSSASAGGGRCLRGVWFGSVAEIGDAVMPSASHGDHGQRPGTPSAGALSVLWQPLLRQVLLEQAASFFHGKVTLTTKLKNNLRGAAIGLVGLGVAAWLGWGYFSERNQLERIQAEFNEGKRLALLQSNTPNLSPLLDISAQMEYALVQIDDNRQFMRTPYIEHLRLLESATKTYHRHLKKTLMPELYNQVQKILISQNDGSPGNIYLTLKIYLMLAKPEKRNSVDVEHWISENWSSISSGQYTDDDRQALLSHVRALFALPDVPATPLDANLVQSARARASQIPSVTRVINNIIEQGLPATIANVSLANAAGYGSAISLRLRSNIPATDSAISGWYTREGYNDVFLARLQQSARAILEEGWVLRDESLLPGNSFEIDKTVEKLADATRGQFLNDYVEHWKNFLNDITVRQVTGLDDAAQLAGSMTDPQSPLNQLIRFAGRATTLTGNYDGDVDNWIDKQKSNIEKGRRSIVGEINGEHYRNKQRPEYIVENNFEAIRSLAIQLTHNDNAGSNPMSRLFESVSNQLALVNGAMQAGQILPQYDAFARLRNEAARQPEPVRGIVLDLLRSGSNMTATQSGNMLKSAATSGTQDACKNLAGRYPLQRHAKSEMAVGDFERLFGPQGEMANNFRDKLAAYVDTSSSPWKAKKISDGQPALINAGAIHPYEIAEKIRNSTLDAAGHLKISAVMRIVDMDPQLSEVRLEIAGQSIYYAHGLVTPHRVDWTAENSNSSIRLNLRTVDGRTNTLQFNGPWAIFKFFDAGRSSGGSADSKETLHQTQLGNVRIEWQAVTLPSPLWSNLLASFGC